MSFHLKEINKSSAYFLIIFLIIIASHIFSITENIFILKAISKPLICLLLMALVYVKTKLKNKEDKLLFFALICGELGDIFLLNPTVEILFILGLASFLIGHITYIFIFKKHISLIPKKFLEYVVTILVILYGLSLFIFLYPYLGEKLIPVFLYIVISAIMLTSSYIIFMNTNISLKILILLGCMLFVISDSVLASQIFIKYSISKEMTVMITYSLAQLFIVIGLLDKKMEL